MIILCPNYAVPYEPHFRILIVFTPALTRRILARPIEWLAADSNAKGLWNSLNFITAPKMRRHCRAHRFKLVFDTAVMSRLLDRLDTGQEHARRQAAVAGLARFLMRLGAGWVLQRLPASFSPYIKALVSPRA